VKCFLYYSPWEVNLWVKGLGGKN